MSVSPARSKFDDALSRAIENNQLQKLSLGKYRGADATLKKLQVRPLQLKSGPHLSFVWRHATQDITKNHTPAEAVEIIQQLIGADFLDAHLFTADQTIQFETAENGKDRVRFKDVSTKTTRRDKGHNRTKSRLIDPQSGWLHELGITNATGQPQKGQTAKFRQIEKFAEILSHRWPEAGLGDLATQPRRESKIRVADMGSGKGYLTFATAALLAQQAEVIGIEQRSGLVDTCNRVASSHGLSNLTFQQGDIATTTSALGKIDVLIALHACDTATDDALAAGISGGARLLVVAPCCQKQLRPQLKAPTDLKGALRHGIFQERHTEFVTDALRALLLEGLGFETKVFEFISSEHTAKNTMITATRARIKNEPQALTQFRDAVKFAQFYGIKKHALATHLGVSLA